MPGRLIMDQQGAIGSQDLKKDRSQAQIASLPKKPDLAQLSPAQQVNGSASHTSDGPLSNGVPTQAAGAPTTNGATTATRAEASSETPPPLDQSWQQDHTSWKSMGKMIERTSQQCYLDLHDNISKLAEMQVQTPSGQTNGILPHAQDTSELSVSKKRQFMEFARDQRDRFMKTAVLVDWAKTTGQEMSTLIDIKVAQDKEQRCQLDAIWGIGRVKKAAELVKQPSPNIRSALDLLATGTASRLPSLNYIQPKRLTAKQLLRTLQSMNVTLATRLSLDEELPPQFQDFTISDGRATFRVPGEFEVDLSVAEEEPSGQFYFIDMRFLFSPSPSGLREDLRAVLESRTNAELSSKGLQGCYDFLHNYVLTHKINVLYNQTARLSREKWFECLHVEKRGRILTIEYWNGPQGRKNWLEIGVATGKQSKGRSRSPANAHISVRWFRRGTVVSDVKLEIDWQHLDVERILSEAIAKNATWILSSVKERLHTLAGPESKLDTQLSTSDVVPEDCALRLSLPGMSDQIVVRHDTVTGQICISPPTLRSSACEKDINDKPNTDIAAALVQLMCNLAKEQVDVATEIADWHRLPSEELSKDNLTRIFKFRFTAHRMYACSKGWGDRWALFVTFSLSGEKWWVVRLADKTSNSARHIVDAREIPVRNSLAVLSRESLLQLEALASAEISCVVLRQELDSTGLRYTIDKLAPLKLKDGISVDERSFERSVFIQDPKVLGNPAAQGISLLQSVRLTHCGLHRERDENDEITGSSHDLCLTLEKGKLRHLQQYLTTKPRNADMVMNASGALALKLRTPFGEPYFDCVKARLQACQRLNIWIAHIKSRMFDVEIANLAKLVFTYGKSPELSVSISFAKDGGLPLTLKLAPQYGNPHHRMRVQLEKLLNNLPVQQGLPAFCDTLQTSLPIMQVLDKIEECVETLRSVRIHIRHPTHYHLEYSDPLPKTTLKVECKERKIANGQSQRIWGLSLLKTTRQELQQSSLGKALSELHKSHNNSDESWYGIGDGVFVAKVNGIAEAFQTVHDTICKVNVNDAAAATQAAGVKVETIQHQQPVHQKPPQKPAASNKPPVAKMSANPRSGANGGVQSQVNGRPAAMANMAKVKKEVIELD